MPTEATARKAEKAVLAIVLQCKQLGSSGILVSAREFVRRDSLLKALAELIEHVDWLGWPCHAADFTL
jgi:hypothetical protein